MSVHAFVDESQRNRRYLLAAALVEPVSLRQLRKDMRALLLPGQRELHFHKEKEARKRKVADAVARMSLAARIYTRARVDRSDEPARAECLRRLTVDLDGDESD